MKTNDIVSHIHPQRARADVSSSRGSTNRTRSSSRYHGRRRYEKQLTRIKLLGGTAGVVALILLVLAKFEIDSLEAQNRHLAIKARKQEVQLEHTNTHLKKLHEDMKVLVEDRIPNLHRLEFDKTILLDQKYVRNIIFTLTGVGTDKQYEYRMVLHNDSLNIVNPLVNVFLFDEVGIQLGMTKNSKIDTRSRVEYVDLRPGEIRSHSSKVPLDRNEKPYYFLVTVE
jgi:hypothetical protein